MKEFPYFVLQSFLLLAHSNEILFLSDQKLQPNSEADVSHTKASYEFYQGAFFEVVRGSDCQRECEYPYKPKICVFQFTISYWHTMNGACGDCPIVLQDCYKHGCIAADGIKRLVQVVNKQLPGPSIQVCYEDIIRVKVKNLLGSGEGTSIHWHGMHQRGTQFHDGVPYITQCHIDNMGTFEYTFRASPSGTHFWHSHSGLQAANGLYGALIVRKAKEDNIVADMYDEDLPEHNIILHLWGSQSDDTSFLMVMSSFDWDVIVVPSNVLINGRGQNVTYDDALTPVQKYYVKQDFKYRFRLIHAGFKNCPIYLTIEDHIIKVIATGSGYIDPVRLNKIKIVPGERYDFVLHASQPIGEYEIRLIGEAYSGCMYVDSTAVLSYINNDQENIPNEIVPDDKKDLEGLGEFGDVNDPNILYSPPAFKNLDKSYSRLFAGKPNLKVIMKLESTNDTSVKAGIIPTATINYVSYRNPYYSLSHISREQLIKTECHMNTLMDCSEKDICSCTNLIYAKLGDLIEIVLLTDSESSDHPMHLHGNNFVVVSYNEFINASGIQITSEFFEEQDSLGLIERNLLDPPVRDTVGILKSGYTIIRFRADNPGWWLFHCHTDVHMELGMAAVLIIGEKEDLPLVPHGYPTCGSWFLTQ